MQFRSGKLAEDVGLAKDKILVSCKVSQVPVLLRVYRKIASIVRYPLHLGLTEAGMGTKGIVSSACALSILLSENIGNTIRVSLTPEPNGDRTQEVKVAQLVLQSLGLYYFMPEVISCPGCGRTTSSYFRQLAADIQKYIEHNIPQWRNTYPGVEKMEVAVMGCVVNGPGESRRANIGISLPGTFEKPKAPVYLDGKLYTTLRGDNIYDEFISILNMYIHKNYTAKIFPAS